MFFAAANSKFCSIGYLSRSLLSAPRPRWYPSKYYVHIGGRQSLRFRLNRCKTSDEDEKVLKVAIIGVPNAGKSTLINQLVGRNVFAVSRKVHTTRCSARAVLISDRTQVIFLDTPGLVSLNESEKHRLEESFLTDSEEAVKEADVVGVIHDVSNTFTRHRLSSKVLRLLHQYSLKRSFLILNKVDAMKHKRDLLELTHRLSTGRSDANVGRDLLTQSEFQEIIDKEDGWPHFESIFMVSALNGDGVGDIKMYLLNSAIPGPWLFDKTTVTDQDEVTVVENVVFSKLLEYLPNVVPYNLKATLEYLNRSQDGSVTAIVLVGCKNLRMQKFIMGKGGGRMKKIALSVEQDLRKYYLNDVRVKLVLVDESQLGNDDKIGREFLLEPGAADTRTRKV
ncbi:GTPase Era, mitochondrial [Planococcus citri]|uniref:GTPase Era, mitochondrial n=1 Tax=Planococcus citri TaxID=170843 RepID=UPI0031F75045